MGDAVNGHESFALLANNINDPGGSLSGNQPATHDNWQSLYEKWRVYKVELELTFINNAEAGSSVLCYCYEDVDASEAFTNHAQWGMDQLRHMKSVHIPASGTGVSGKVYKIHFTHYPASVNVECGNDENAQIFGTAPNEKSHLIIGCMAANGTILDDDSVDMWYKITQYTVLTNPNLEIQIEED